MPKNKTLKWIKKNPRSIQQTLQLVLLIAVAIAAFALGRLSVLEPQDQKITIEESSSEMTTLSSEEIQPFVASQNGTKYYPVWCQSASRINDENKIYFESQQMAQSAGYELSTTCEDQL